MDGAGVEKTAAVKALIDGGADVNTVRRAFTSCNRFPRHMRQLTRSADERLAAGYRGQGHSVRTARCSSSARAGFRVC